MEKVELRKKYKALRKELSQETIDELSIGIANQLLQLNIWEYSFYHIFLSIASQKEVNTDFILNILQGKDKNVVLSKSDFKNNTLNHFLLTDSTKININDYDIPEPVDGISINDSQIEVVFIPLLAYDKSGHRVGYGKGFYDRFLSQCKPEIVKIGLSFYEPEQEIDDIFISDKALNYCITPKHIHKF